MLRGPRRLFLMAFAAMILTAAVLTWAWRPTAGNREAGAWPAVRMVLEARGLLLHPAERVRYEYLRDAAGRWVLIVRDSSNPAQEGDWLRYDGYRVQRFVQAEAGGLQTVAVGAGLEAHPLLSDEQIGEVDRLLASSQALITGADPLPVATATVVEHQFLEDGRVILEKFWINPSWRYLLRYERIVGGSLAAVLAVTFLEVDPALPEGFPVEIP